MTNRFIKLNKHCKLLLFLFLIFGYQYNYAQIYQHDFGTTTINSHPYSDAPTIFNTNLSNSSWSNTTGTWSNGTGNMGNAIRLSSTASPTETITLTFNVASNYQLAVTSFNFWRVRSNTGAQNWAMKINGIDVGTGTVPTTGSAIGVTNVTNAVAGLTGTVTVQIILSGATGTGTFRLDDFILNGSVTTTCVQPAITSFFPTNGPRNTVVAITGNGFQAGTGTSSVKFNGFEATSFNVISNTLLEAVVPTNTTTGNISITTNNCTGLSTSPFTIINSTYNITYSSDIYISEIYDAQMGDGGIFEIYNGTAVAKNLSNYSLERYLNIGGTLDYTINLSGTILPGEIFLIGIGTSTIPCGILNYFPFATGFNGNDEFNLLNNGVLIDNVQAPPFAGYSIVRNLTAIAPKPAFDPADWTIISTESCAGIGANAPITTIPIASVNPVKRIICENESTTFTTTLNAGLTYTYQWKVLTASNTWVNVVNNANYSGATSYILSINNAPASFDKNQYYCEVNSTSFKIISNAVQLLVSPIPAAPILADTQPTCATATGSITVTTPALGTGFTYSIDGTNFQVSNEFLALAPNTYNISVKNAAGCISTTSQKIINNAVGTPNAPTLELTQPTCTTSTGSVKVKNPDLGTGFTYSIDGTNFQVSNEFLALTPNTYNVSVKDGGGCISPITLAIIFNAPTFPKEPKITITQPTCSNPLGQIKINPPVDPSYTYSIDNINYQSSPIFDNLFSGSYYVTARNYYGCTSTIKIAIINITPTVPVAPTLISTDPTCLISKGSIEVTAPLGNDFSYSIDGITFQNSTVFNNVEADDYNIFVKNLDGCISNPTTIIINPVPQAPSTRDVYYFCVDQNNVVISPANIDTGLSNLDYSFYWTFNGSLINNTASKIEADQEGIYRVVATNLITGCEIHLTATVKKSSPATATATVGIDFDYVQTITVNITSGISEYLYQLNEGPFQESNVFNISLGGTYTITVKDKNGCNDFVFTIDAYNFPRFFTPNGDGFNDFWNINEIPNPAQSTILIFDRMGKLLKQISPTGGGWDGTFVNKPMPATDYWFVLKYEDINGSQKELKSHFALKR